MTLPPGTRLGVYELLAQVGAGGMGEVYRARDPKLDREVAIKVLPPHLAADASLLARFEQEAKAVAALSHPNILGIFDFGREDGQAYAVMELLEGESLRERLREGALPVRRAVEVAAQAAQGLAAAHAKGIVHRDVKPENLFLCRDGRVKVLDFGLAKQGGPVGDQDASTAACGPLDAAHTAFGVVMGTVGYMAPEQVRGDALDGRADIFALGTVLYEMLSGRRAFKRDASIGTLQAILHEDPEDLQVLRGDLPPALEQVVARCLEKRPADRFQSMTDLAFALSTLGTTTGLRRRTGGRSWRRALPLLAGLGGVLAAAALGALAWGLDLPPFRPAPAPAWARVTHGAAAVESARFTADGRSVYFTARLRGGRPEVFVVTPESPDPRPLGLADAVLLGVSPGGELAVLRRPQRTLTSVQQGVLLKVPAGGGPGIELQEGVADAAWDGRNLALLVLDPAYNLRLEYPVGHALWTVRAMDHPAKFLRCSTARRELALVEGIGGQRTEVAVYGPDGARRVLYTRADDGNGSTVTGMAWHPNGELWFTELQGDQTALMALGGRRPRMVWRGGGAHELLDISAGGRVLLAAQQVRRSVLLHRDGAVRDLSILGGSQALGLSPDGRSVLLLESPVLDGGTAHDLTWMRGAEGSPPVRLGRGQARGLSVDGAWACLYPSDPDAGHMDDHLAAAFREAGLDPATALDPARTPAWLAFLPTAAGRPWVLRLPERLRSADLGLPVPGQDTVVFYGFEPGRPGRVWRSDRRGGNLQALTPEGMDFVFAGLSPMAPDGRSLLVARDARTWFRAGLDGGEPQPLASLGPGERMMGWSGDGRGLLVRSAPEDLPVRVLHLDPADGSRRELATLALPDPAGQIQVRGVYASADGRAFACTVERRLSDLFQVSGLR